MARVQATGRVLSTRTNNILFNGNFEVKPSVITADTNTVNRWIDGTAAGSTAKLGYGWAVPSSGSGVGANAAAGFDTTVFRSGLASLRLSTLNASGTCLLMSIKGNPPVASTGFEVFMLRSNTQYTLTAYARTNNVVANGAFVDVREFSGAFATLATNTTNKLGGTDTSWRPITVTFTTNASTVFGAIFLRNNIAGNTSDVWYDDITLVPLTTGRTIASGRVVV